MTKNLWMLAILAGSLSALPVSPAAAQCLPGLCTGDIPTGQCGIDDTVCTGSPSNYGSGNPCAGNGCNFVHNCRTPTVSGPSVEILPQPDGTFTARLKMDVRAPWNDWASTNNPNGTLDMFWYDTASVPELCDTGFDISICEYLGSDHTECWVQQTGLTCAGAPYDFGTFSFRAQTCGGPGVCGFPFPPTCGRWVDRSGLDFVVTKEMLGCPTPPKDDCDDCKACKLAGPGRGNAGGGGGRGAPPKSGPGALLRYAAGGAGHPGFPGSAAWTPTLGRYWSHDYAERIVQDPDDSHVWLITRGATFRQFSGLAAGIYQTVSPSDEYRKLHKTASGWELHELDGTVHHFDAAGLWAATVDRNGNAKVATYSAGQLASVTFPDGRGETFTYHPSGKLATITEVGVGAAASRTWSYTWTGDDLVRIDRPDGTAWEFFYTDTAHPGYMTRMELVGTDNSRRVETAWEYDTRGNVVKIWRGDASFAGADAVEKWSFSFDDPARPAVTTITDPLGDVSTYTIGRDTASDKPRITAISGDCPSCGLGPNSQIFYEDPDHPLRPTRTVDGRGTTTLYAWDAGGMMTSMTEAAGTPLERTTTWEHNGPFPDLVTRMEMPSTSGTGVKATVSTYDAEGNLLSRTVTGVEAGSAFSFTRTTSYNAAGMPTLDDPPGYGAQDQTSHTYDPARGDLLPLSRVEPLVGTTSFAYDAFNQTVSTTRPSGLTTETAYDPLGRATAIIHKGATPAEDLTTIQTYDVFGDLARVTLPEGNLIEYTYDTAGRIVAMERKPDASTPGERTAYTLDGAGNRIREELQRWNGASWSTDSSTEYVYSSRCRLDQVIHADGSVTEHDYDCEGNLTHLWDANHPSAGKTSPASRVYSYDVLNRITSVSHPWTGAGGGSAVTTFAYDVQNHPVQITDPNGTVTRYVYSDRGLRTREESEASGVTIYSYNEHAGLVSQTDARNVTVTRALDARDRVTFVDNPDNALDISYTWDDPAVPFSTGQLTAITRNGQSIAFTYDRFGRLLQDGELSYGYDRNGNRRTVIYPGNQTATWGYDFADRETSLAVADGVNPAVPLVTSISYKAFGPADQVALGNGLVETRTSNPRYFPTAITVPGRLDWAYTTDAMGNVTAIADALAPASSRTFTYQDYAYFLTGADGPWGTRAWTWDKAGNRLTATRDGATDVYTYAPNAGGGNSPRLAAIAHGGTGGSSQFFLDAAGDLIYETGGQEKLRYTYDGDRRLSQLRNDAESAALSRFTYDGRSFLAAATFFSTPGAATPERETTAVYASEGALFYRSHLQRRSPSSPRNQPEIRREASIFYIDGRPVAVLEKTTSTPLSGAPSVSSALTWLTTDHLGAPILATNASGGTVWQGGFEPFGEDWNGASDAGIFLRLPGQWEDAAWSNSRLPSGLAYNLMRWYDAATGGYTRPDPLGIDGGDATVYSYAARNPLLNSDPLGLLSVVYKPRPNDQVQRDCGSKTALGCTKPSFRAECECKCINGKWFPQTRVFQTGPIEVYYSNDCYDPQRIRQEEDKHVRQFGKSFQNAQDVARDFARRKKDNEVQCEITCQLFYTKVRQELGSPWTHWFIDRSHPWRKCDGSLDLF